MYNAEALSMLDGIIYLVSTGNLNQYILQLSDNIEFIRKFF
ncbi:CRPV-066 [Crowpox virus]|nr:CRPV-066 [Crowpox virus]